MSETDSAGVAEEGEAEEDETEEQPGSARTEAGQNGERRPRRRGRRGGRRRRGGPEDGLAGSISDELAPSPRPEAESAVADFDGASEPAPSLVQQHEPPAYAPEPTAEPARTAANTAPTPEETAAEAEKTARRRSTVREKVSFMTSPTPDTAPAMPATTEPAASAPGEAAPAASGETDEQPRKAGWWSRRFGGE
jgi:ribonuclease E